MTIWDVIGALTALAAVLYLINFLLDTFIRDDDDEGGFQ